MTVFFCLLYFLPQLFMQVMHSSLLCFKRLLDWLYFWPFLTLYLNVTFAEKAIKKKKNSLTFSFPLCICDLCFMMQQCSKHTVQCLPFFGHVYYYFFWPSLEGVTADRHCCLPYRGGVWRRQCYVLRSKFSSPTYSKLSLWGNSVAHEIQLSVVRARLCASANWFFFFF